MSTSGSVAATVVRIFVSSTWLDLQAERSAVERLLQRFREAKFVGMEYFGSRDETTRGASLDEVARSDLYLGIVAGRFGSGITEAEYDKARSRGLPSFVYFKQEETIADAARDEDPADRARLDAFKARLTDAKAGHIVARFAGPQELATLVAADLHNWLFDKYLSPALERAATGALGTEQAGSLREDLESFTKLDRDLLAQLGAERQRSEGERRVALDAFYELTYEIPKLLEPFPALAEAREAIVRKNLQHLERLVALDAGNPEVLRELATNWRLLGTTLMARGASGEALAAFEKSAEHGAVLVRLKPAEALYQRDLAVSHLNAGSVREALQDGPGAQREYALALPAARRAADLDARWNSLRDDAEARTARRPPPGPAPAPAKNRPPRRKAR